MHLKCSNLAFIGEIPTVLNDIISDIMNNVYSMETYLQLLVVKHNHK